jgi:hypothetical protein
MNQCDGCRREMPFNSSGNHVGKEPWDMMGCTKDRYEQPAKSSAIRTWLRAHKAAVFKQRLDHGCCTGCGDPNVGVRPCQNCRDAAELCAIMMDYGPALLTPTKTGFNIVHAPRGWIPGDSIQWVKIDTDSLEARWFAEAHQKLMEDLLRAPQILSVPSLISTIEYHTSLKRW